MKPWRRVMLQLLAPPALGALGFVLWSVGESAWRSQSWEDAARLLSQLPAHWLLYAVFAYLIAGLPAVICTIVIECCYARGLDPASGWTVLVSGVLGALSGVGIIAVPWMLSDQGAVSPDWGWMTLLMGGLGCIVGAVLGLLVCWRTRVARRSALHHPTAHRR